MALLTDGRFSGGTHGFCIGHVAPEAVEGGPIAFVKTGDRLIIDAANRRIDHDISDAELARRKEGLGAAAAARDARRAGELLQVRRVAEARVRDGYDLMICLRNDVASAASREDPLGRSEAPQRALDDDAAPRPRQGLALENGQSPHALLAHRAAADERPPSSESRQIAQAGTPVSGGGACAALIFSEGQLAVDRFARWLDRPRKSLDRRVGSAANSWSS